MFYCSPYRCKIEQPDTPQHNGVTNYQTEMCMWKYVVLVRVIGSSFPLR